MVTTTLLDQKYKTCHNLALNLSFAFNFPVELNSQVGKERSEKEKRGRAGGDGKERQWSGCAQGEQHGGPAGISLAPLGSSALPGGGEECSPESIYHNNLPTPSSASTLFHSLQRQDINGKRVERA